MNIGHKAVTNCHTVVNARLAALRGIRLLKIVMSCVSSTALIQTSEGSSAVTGQMAIGSETRGRSCRQKKSGRALGGRLVQCCLSLSRRLVRLSTRCLQVTCEDAWVWIVELCKPPHSPPPLDMTTRPASCAKDADAEGRRPYSIPINVRTLAFQFDDLSLVRILVTF